MRLLVTGAAGYVGSHVVRAALAAGHEVAALVRADDATPIDGTRREKGDLADTHRMRQLAADHDGIVHAAASDDPSFATINLGGVRAMLSGLGADAAFVAPGGSMVFGSTGDRVFDGTEPYAPSPPLAPTAATLSTISDGPGTGRRAVVFGSLVHGGERAAIPATLVDAARRSGGAVYPGTGNARWSTVDIRDWATLIVAAVERTPVGGRRWMAASGETSVRDAVGLLASILGAAPPRALPADEVDEAFGFFATPLQTNQRFSALPAETMLGWRPVHLDLAAGFRDAVAATA